MIKSIKFVAVIVAFFAAAYHVAFGATSNAKPSAKPTSSPKPSKPSLPTITVLGRLGADAEVKIVGKESKTVVEFSLAEDLFTGKKDEQTGKPNKTTVWYKVACWNGLGDRAQYLTKGQEVVVRGFLTVTPGAKREFRDITAAVVRLTTPLPEASTLPTEEELPG